ncbi:MAG: sensor histidine kinase [Candidatus Fimimonas sp.]
MIDKLRKRIVAINVVTACLILFCAVIGTFTVGITRINNDRDKRMISAVTSDDPLQPNDKLYSDIAVVSFNQADPQNATVFLGANCEMNEETVQKYLQRVAEFSQESGFVDLHIRYIKVVEDDTVKIAFSNLSSRYNGLTAFLWLVLGALVIGLLGHFVISFLLAQMALKPVEESWNKQKQFVADASHELKTPLSVIMANNDVIMSHKDETVESQMKWLENTRSEAQRMADLVADLLFLAKNDDGLKVQMENVNFSDCVSSVVLGYDAVFYENNKIFEYQVAPNVQLFGNVNQLKQLATILLDNANKYSKGAGNIKLTLCANNKHAQLVVQNDSEQLSDEQLSHLFDRFYTVDPSRNKNNGGNGLGLSIAKIICETHGGNIKATCVNGVTSFVATFPLKKQ